VWQWLHKKIQLEDGRIFTQEMYQQLKEEEIEKIKKYVGDTQYVNGKFELAIQLFDKLVLNKEFVEFLTLPAYQYI
jgi:malate synthase